MKLIFYIFWRAFNMGKQKGYFLENILLLMSLELFAIAGCLLILFEEVFNIDIRKYMFNVRSEDMTERILAMALGLFLSYVIFKMLKIYFVSNNKYKKAIKEYDIKYRKTKDSVFLWYFLVITFLSFFSLWITGVLLR